MTAPLDGSADKPKDLNADKGDKPEAKAVQSFTTSDWQLANKNTKPSDLAKPADQAKPTEQAKPADQAKPTEQTKPVDQVRDVLTNPAASAEDKLKAVEALGRSGQTKVDIVDKDGTKRSLTIELEKAGARTMLHVYATDDSGKDHVVLRGIKNADGSYQQQQTEKGDAVGSYGSWWSKNMGDKSYFTEAKVADQNKVADQTKPGDQKTGVADQKTSANDLFPSKRNDIPAEAASTSKLADASAQANLFPDKRNILPETQIVQPLQPAKVVDTLADQPVNPVTPARVADSIPDVPTVAPTRVADALPDKPLVPETRDVVPWNKPEQRVVSDEERLNTLFDGVARSAGYARRLTPVEGGSVYFRAGMAIDADGSRRARQIDPDGQSQTSLRHKNGAAVDAESTKYFVLPLKKYQQYGVHLGDIAAVRYGDNVRFAVFADVGPHQKLGEGSMALADSLGINSNPRHGGTQRPEVEYIVFPGSGNGRPLHSNAHEDLGRHYLGKAYRQTKS